MHRPDSKIARVRIVGPLDRAVLRVIIKADDLMARCQQFLDQVTSNESSRTSDKYLHFRAFRASRSWSHFAWSCCALEAVVVPFAHCSVGGLNAGSLPLERPAASACASWKIVKRRRPDPTETEPWDGRGRSPSRNAGSRSFLASRTHRLALLTIVRLGPCVRATADFSEVREGERRQTAEPEREIMITPLLRIGCTVKL